MAIASWAPLTKTSRICHIGDSVTGPFGSPSVSPFLLSYAAMRAQFGSISVPTAANPFVPMFAKWPKIGYSDGVAGRTCNTLGSSAPTFATFCTNNMLGPFTHAVVQLGINDAAAIQNLSQNIGQVTAAHLVILDGLNSIWGIPYASILTVGPWQRPADLSVQVPQVVSAFQANSSLRGSAFVDWSGISSAGGLSIGDQTHPSATGAVLLAAPISVATSITP